MLAKTTDVLIAAVQDPSSTKDEIDAASQSFFNAVSQTSRIEADQALLSLSDHFDLVDPSRAAHLALMCGALLEKGCDPKGISSPLIERLRSLLELSAALADACIAMSPPPERQGEEEEEDQYEVFENQRNQLAPSMPKEFAAWNALELFWRPAIALFSVSAESRFSAQGLHDLAIKISDFHEGGHWLGLMLSVFNNEPILVIDPRSLQGILARISGVVDNFQLNVLLMDAFPKSSFWSRRRVSQRVAENALGKGSQQTNDVVKGFWNLYSWEAIKPDLTLPDPNDDGGNTFWIWNEGVPGDIPQFEGRRVILLGSASYPRTWQSQRMFAQLPAKLEIESELSNSEVKQWVQRMAVAKGKKG